MSKDPENEHLVSSLIQEIIEQRNLRLEEETEMLNGPTGDWISVLSFEDAGVDFGECGFILTMPDGNEYNVVVERTE